MDFAFIIIGFIVGSTSLRKLTGDFAKTKINLAPKVSWPAGAWVKALFSVLDFLKAPLLIVIAQQYSAYTAVWTALTIIAAESFPASRNVGRGIIAFLGCAWIITPQFYLLGLAYPFILAVFPYRYIAFLGLVLLLPFVLMIFNAEPQAIVFSLIAIIILPLRQMKHINNYFSGTEPTIMEEFKKRNKR